MEHKTLTHFFNKRVYTVPAYQRGYSWQERQILDLLSDVNHAIKLNSNHYTGTITIHPQPQKIKIGLNNYENYHIVDGQQRFITIILILSYLIKELAKKKETKKDALEKEQTYICYKGSYLFQYCIDKVSENYFRSLVLEHENLSSLDENLYTRNLREAKEVIKRYFEKEENKNQLVNFLNAIEERLQFNEYIVNNTTEIGIVFETMNNRGIGLSNLEIVKNRLLYLTSKINLGEDDASFLINLSETINNKWAIMLRNLTLPNKVLDEDTFLSNHWIIYNGWSKDNMAKTEILNQVFTIEEMVKDPKGMINKISEYINSLATTSLHWRFINYPDEDNSFIEIKEKELREEIKRYFNKLNRLSNSTVRPLLLAFTPLMKYNPKGLLELVRTAEVFSFRLFSMNKRRSDTGKNDIFRRCNNFHINCKNEIALQKALWYLAWYIDEYGDYERFKLEVEESFKSNKKDGFYSWYGLSYFLYEYEECLRGKEDMKVNYSFAQQKTKSIEHILPQTIENTAWKEILSPIARKKDEIKKSRHSLGNLLLISSNKNSSLRNSDFKTKVKSYRTGSFSENEIASLHRIWTINKIKYREKTLINFMKEHWGLDETFTEKYPSPGNEAVDINDEYTEENEIVLHDVND